VKAGGKPGLFFDPEDGSDMFIRNVGWLSTDYTALYPRRQNSSREESVAPAENQTPLQTVAIPTEIWQVCWVCLSVSSALERTNQRHSYNSVDLWYYTLKAEPCDRVEAGDTVSLWQTVSK
jgi:hypothetical protein